MLGYFGPAGTFTHQALRMITDEEAVAFSSVREALDAVRHGDVSGAVVPIENSVEGGVSATLDELIAGEPLAIRAEIVIPVEFGLYAREGTQLADVRQVLTHGHAAAQCRQWLAEKVPRAQVTEAGSTAGAAAEVARPESRYDAAVCARVAGDTYGLTELAYAIEDNPGAVTRFVEVGKAGPVARRTGADKTTLVAYMREDHSGALLEILEQFAVRGVNLTRIESRPTKTTLGSYCFSIDVEGHLHDKRVGEALEGLHRVCPRVHFLGSYPRADESRPKVGDGFTDDSYDAAAAWVESLGLPFLP
ncbi:prephenate dehydratase [Tessaracoccus sp. MC1865]|uniref:prephenate dehydratase n=1 Tax=Tessaracoccus sp. MC1865 TaxID=2760310 RepID=UPI001603B17D|nr:prephenate dehydratase [Tessaracoccus sp. MC1865]MBB1482834.1 prephenate dehydratase [Tessaracoccus sp. MC1865]QTO37727.1 prephenate dehydratase [Tessaracoccus sp. MC1865]